MTFVKSIANNWSWSGPLRHRSEDIWKKPQFLILIPYSPRLIIFSEKLLSEFWDIDLYYLHAKNQENLQMGFGKNMVTTN